MRSNVAVERHTVEVERRIAATPVEVFAYLTEPDLYVRWQGTSAELDPRPGGAFRVRMNADTVAAGQYLEVEPPSRVVLSWGWEGSDEIPPGSTRVEILLEDVAEGTLLRLRHTGLPDDQAAAMHREGWDRYGDRLVVVAGGGDAGPEPLSARHRQGSDEA
jgi:uncharacterized protein YndB with AHSA1/START domain